jgi:hypothetical protein
MTTDDLAHRIRRMYAAVEAVEEADISKFLPQVINDGHRIGFYQDWSGGLNDADLANFANSLIQNIASLEYHLKKWADHNGRDKTKVDAAFKSSLALKIIHDLWNNDKHGYPPRNGGHSGKSPKLGEVRRFVRLTTKAEKDSYVCMTVNVQGVSQISGSGTAKVIISGDILDRDANNIGDFHKTALEAVEAWESVLADFGVTL